MKIKGKRGGRAGRLYMNVLAAGVRRYFYFFILLFQDAEQPYVGTAAGLQGCIKKDEKRGP